MKESKIRISIQLTYLSLYLFISILLINMIESNIHENTYLFKIISVIGLLVLSNMVYEPIINKTYKIFNIKPNDRADTITAIRGAKKLLILITFLASAIISFVVFMILRENAIESVIASFLSFILSQALFVVLIKESFEKE